MDGSSFSASDLNDAVPAMLAQPGDDGIALLARHYRVNRTTLEKFDRDPERGKCRSLTDIAAAQDFHTRITTIAAMLDAAPNDILRVFTVHVGLSRQKPETVALAVTDTIAILQRHGIEPAAAKKELLQGDAVIVLQVSNEKLERRVKDLATWHGQGLFRGDVALNDAVLHSLRSAVVGDAQWAAFKRVAELRATATGTKPQALFAASRKRTAETIARYETQIAAQNGAIPSQPAKPKERAAPTVFWRLTENDDGNFTLTHHRGSQSTTMELPAQTGRVLRFIAEHGSLSPETRRSNAFMPEFSDKTFPLVTTRLTAKDAPVRPLLEGSYIQGGVTVRKGVVLQYVPQGQAA